MFMPKTKLGKWSVFLIIGFILFMFIFFYFVSLDFKGGDTFLSNPYLAIPISLAGLCGVSSFVVGIISVFHKERSVLVYLSILIGAFVLLFISGEIFTPH
jgi:hypothetical protein